MKNIAHSVRQRLLNRSKDTGQPNEYVLLRYAIERLLYRLSVSPHADRFVLKGALLFAVWGEDEHRPTRDADLLGTGQSDPAHLMEVFREICAIPGDDGIVFDADSIEGTPIAEDKIYSGVRITLRGTLAGARIPVQIDVGFGDAVSPGPERRRYPVLLDFPAPLLQVYPVYTVVAEKLHAMVALGLDNSRMKDFYDLWTISRRATLETSILADAIVATFARRGTPIPAALPVALTPEFAVSPGRAKQWAGFVRRSGLAEGVTLEQTQAAIAAMIGPALNDARKSR